MNTSVYRFQPVPTSIFTSSPTTPLDTKYLLCKQIEQPPCPQIPVNRTKEEKKITEGLKANGYTAALIRRHANATVESETMDNRTPKVFVTLPYTKGLSECVGRILIPLDIQVNCLSTPLHHPHHSGTPKA